MPDEPISLDDADFTPRRPAASRPRNRNPLHEDRQPPHTKPIFSFRKSLPTIRIAIWMIVLLSASFNWLDWSSIIHGSRQLSAIQEGAITLVFMARVGGVFIGAYALDKVLCIHFRDRSKPTK